jgi:hypothetical protein
MGDRTGAVIKLRKLLKPGYKAYNGHIFTQRQCDQYNIIQDRINAAIKACFPVSEDLLNASH